MKNSTWFEELVDPDSRLPLNVDPESGEIRGSDGTVKYALVDGIVDFCGGAGGETAAYDAISSAYDGCLNGRSASDRLYNRLVWGVQDEAYTRSLLDLYPNASGSFCLDLPVGTGVLTEALYSQLPPNARLCAMDYSMGMLRQAKDRLSGRSGADTFFIRADVGNIPLADASVDILLTMNGFHAFPDKNAALSEFTRVLKPGGVLLGCFYVRKQRVLTDLFIRLVYHRMGIFVPPHFTSEEILDTWGLYFDFDVFKNCNSILWFRGIRKTRAGKSGSQRSLINEEIDVGR